MATAPNSIPMAGLAGQGRQAGMVKAQQAGGPVLKVRLKAAHAAGASWIGARVWHVKVRQNILSRHSSRTCRGP